MRATLFGELPEKVFRLAHLGRVVERVQCECHAGTARFRDWQFGGIWVRRREALRFEFDAPLLPTPDHLFHVIPVGFSEKEQVAAAWAGRVARRHGRGINLRFVPADWALARVA